MLKEETEELKISGKSIHCITFVLVADSEENMNMILLCLTNKCPSEIQA